MSDGGQDTPVGNDETFVGGLASLLDATLVMTKPLRAEPPRVALPDLPAALRSPTPMQLLANEPYRFDFDQAVAVATRGGDPLSLRFRTAARLGYPWGEVLAARPDAGELTLGTFGMIGAGGVLPRHFTATVAKEDRKRSHALHAFLDMVGSRLAGLHALAGAKYRPTREPRTTDRVLSAAIGMGTAGLDGRLPLSSPELLYHAGNLAARTRSVERLRAMLEDEAGSPVMIEEFVGAWIRLPASEQTRVAGGGPASTGLNAGLGAGAAAGAAVWDPMARFVIRLGPLPRAVFDSFLPGTPRHRRLVELTRLFVGLDTSYAVNLILARQDVPSAQLGSASRLGWSSWLGLEKPRTKDASDAIFDACLSPQGTP